MLAFFSHLVDVVFIKCGHEKQIHNSIHLISSANSQIIPVIIIRHTVRVADADAAAACCWCSFTERFTVYDCRSSVGIPTAPNQIQKRKINQETLKSRKRKVTLVIRWVMCTMCMYANVWWHARIQTFTKYSTICAILSYYSSIDDAAAADGGNRTFEFTKYCQCFDPSLNDFLWFSFFYFKANTIYSTICAVSLCDKLFQENSIL